MRFAYGNPLKLIKQMSFLHTREITLKHRALQYMRKLSVVSLENAIFVMAIVLTFNMKVKQVRTSCSNPCSVEWKKDRGKVRG